MATLAATIVGGFVCISARAFRWQLPVNNDYSLQKSYVRLRETRLRELKKEQNSKDSGLSARSRRAKRERSQ